MRVNPFHVAMSLLLGSTYALTVPNIERHRIHESREDLPHGWSVQGDLPKDAILPVRIALAQSNLDKLEDYIMSVSHPDSESYGQHWTSAEVAETFAPSQASVAAVRSWLYSHDVAPERITVSNSLGWLHLNMTIGEVESLLMTKYSLYRHESGVTQVACERYHVPHELSDHIDFITPTVHFDAKVGRSPIDSKVKRDDAPAVDDAPAFVHPVSNVVPGAMYPSLHNIYDQLKNCSQYITPDCLRALYSIPYVWSSVQRNPLGIVEYTPQAYVQSDLDLFFANYSQQQQQRTPILDSIDGGYIQTVNRSFNYNGESNLDLEYAMTLVNPIPVTLYQAGDPIEGASFNDFLDAIDGTYCTFEGGDDPDQDGIYPDPFGTAAQGAYKGPKNCGGYAATKVISTSYGYNEYDLTPFYTARQCAEYAKLGLQGVSVLYSSGDYGVAGNSGQCVNAKTLQYNRGNTGRFNPSFPSTCPYVTSVGATQVIPGTDLLRDLATHTQPEQACETIIYSGGGFSDYFAMPSYQRDAVNSYVSNYPPPYTARQYNNSGTSRAFPDVSANGANYVIAIDGEWGLVYGTSASSPTFASVVTIINEYRAQRGKGSVGFLNPTLYANPWVLNDIVNGTNQGCGTQGFSAEPGWDPVTGLGTPNTPKMLQLFLSLP